MVLQVEEEVEVKVLAAVAVVAKEGVAAEKTSAWMEVKDVDLVEIKVVAEVAMLVVTIQVLVVLELENDFSWRLSVLVS